MDVHQTVKSSKPGKHPIDSTEDVFLALCILCHTHQHLPQEHLSDMLNYSLSRQSTVQIVLKKKRLFSHLMHRVGLAYLPTSVTAIGLQGASHDKAVIRYHVLMKNIDTKRAVHRGCYQVHQHNSLLSVFREYVIHLCIFGKQWLVNLLTGVGRISGHTL